MQYNKLTSDKCAHFDTQKYHKITLQASNCTQDLLNKLLCSI